MLTEQYFTNMGYTCVRQLKNGDWVGVYRYIYTSGLHIGLTEVGYKKRYCYEHYHEAVIAVSQYEGGDPWGPWIKEKGEDGERLGPGAKETKENSL